MEHYLFLFAFLAVAVLFALLLRFIRKKLGSALNWPLFSFLALLGAAANNTAAVWYGGGEAFLPSGGGFFGGDNLTSIVTGMLLAGVAVVGILVTLPKPLPSRQPCAFSSWCWSWVLGQAFLSCVIYLLGALVSFRSLPDYPGIPLWGYLVLMAVLIPLSGWLFGRRFGKPSFIPIVWTAALMLLSIALLTVMLRTAHDTNWGLSLTQAAGGSWYTRICLPSAILIGDFQYAWRATPALLYLTALAPHLLFLAGWLGAVLTKPSETRANREESHHPN